MSFSKRLNIFLGLIVLGLLILIQTSKNNSNAALDLFNKMKKQESAEQAKETVKTHRAWVSLTVSESKRLIGRGLREYKPIKENLKNGQIIIARGSTNTYVAEELLNDSIQHGRFLTGRITPQKNYKRKRFKNAIAEIYLKAGEHVEMSFDEALTNLKEGAIVLKGANVLNYHEKSAAVLIGHPTGGTIGKMLPVIKDNRARLIIPVGLEKNISAPMAQLLDKHKNKLENVGRSVPRIWPLPGEVFTEIEAIKQFADVEVYQLASGGLAGAEGAVSLVIEGNKSEVEKALNIVNDIQGEPSFYKR
ncbi:hypothetical protein EYV94_25510 [Puteibacter caeruleilacunae]|nr:hypothetical protein EYV94_25510 [Puteibacter caeruleilacunae]